ncbi:MAG: sulfite reductase subunit alpha [Bradyrhizobium sp.]|uniref:sulfite reductase subunit alpha n=1 Tax=Bradyrhizobium sp. TaxID=376 RepID=UPI001C297B87|nr:sulfite reductase subunit alpha [Bradyrhizobium sp.]MBU6464600.1 sulfite reductase subunit alpha [Pseudomonadota bacterium]MDE2068888.1 sulfite reductase subunit alpha [Bradyrhizobium sp.]MDE2241699.1 sulfite reductase subunit alpha [Bradyrhizobium sp.]MDE2471671.1 sulfite reductase subunit alpha [Bradyrhizobium sp.]
MNQITSSRLEVIPENAPFSEAQRSWLNGFLVGLLQLDHAVPLSPVQGTGLLQEAAGDSDDGEAPWHDQTMPIAERMKLAEGRPLRRRMMAAMAQQDCGQCGYNCSDYSDAIASRSEARLNLCVPGGKETARMLKVLHEELEGPYATHGPAAPTTVTAPVIAGQAGRSRDDPVAATFVSRRLLNKAGSGKQTWHIEFDLSGCGLDYTVGDSFGIFAKNDLGNVDQIIALLGASHTTEVTGKTLRDALISDVSLSPAPDTLFELLSFITGGAQREKARALAQGEDPDGDAATLDVMAALQKFSGVRPHPEAFVEALEPLQPRLYSISSSHNATPGKLSLTVDSVRYVVGKRKRLGLASIFLAERIQPGEEVKVYVQKANGFALPKDPNTPIIMIGPGTGVAPFRAFLQDRRATRAAGKNWLFFGHQHSACDFFYADELNAMKTAGLLTRLSLAWSRDGDRKFYVQDRMREVGRELWTWLAEGAHVYVCGDAKRMARDVERALVDIVAQFGARSTDESVAFLGELKKKGRLQQDVY